MHKVLIGGQALTALGSTRNSLDTDYLVNIEGNPEPFITGPNIDLINANGHKFFMEIWNLEKENSMATPQSLLELKCFAFVQHCLNGNWQKADDAEYDIKFLVRKFGLKEIKIVSKYLSLGELSEVNKVIKSVK